MSTPGIDAPILVVNAGSSSIKFAVFDGNLNNRLAGIADGIGGAASLKVGTDKQDVDLPDHVTALQAILHGLEACDLPISGFRMAAHRVVHGGSELTAPVRITSKTRLAIANCTPLAPLHNPHHLSAIDTLAALAPDLAQYASFDTGFHATMPKVETTYALPTAITARGLRRYGFHGISYASLVRLMPELSGAPLPDRLLAFHLGNGVSACAIRKGHSVATTMGYSPLEGLTMGTRTGDIDANAVLRLAREDGIEATATLLNWQSGLRGLSGGTSDMRALLDCETPDCGFAVEHFCYHAVRHAGALIATLQGCDAIAFTGGIGENAAPIRRKIMEGLAWLGLKVDHSANENNSTALHTSESSVAAWIIPAQEERMIAADALQLMQQEGA